MISASACEMSSALFQKGKHFLIGKWRDWLAMRALHEQWVRS